MNATQELKQAITFLFTSGILPSVGGDWEIRKYSLLRATLYNRTCMFSYLARDKNDRFALIVFLNGLNPRNEKHKNTFQFAETS